MSTIKVNTIQNTSGVEVYTCKAWVNFNGTGTVAIRASGNVSSITDNGTGDYTVNFTTAMPDANYCLVCSSKAASVNTRGGSYVGAIELNTAAGANTAAQYTASSIRIGTASGSSTTSSGTVIDIDAIDVAIFR